MKIGDHVFHIPYDNIASEEIPWLPSSKEESIVLILNPNAPLNHQIIAMLRSKSFGCGNVSASDSGNWVHLCRHIGTIVVPTKADFIGSNKIYDDAKLTWKYVANRPSGSETLAVCVAPAAGGPGKCEHLYIRGDLIVALSLDEDQLTALPEIRANFDKSLTAWTEVT